MGKITGRETVFAFKKAATWRTAVAVGAGDGFFMLSDGMTGGRSIEVLNDDSLSLPWVQDSDSGLEAISGDITAYLRYQQELLPCLAVGSPQTKTGAGPDYDMLVYLTTTLRGLFGTFALLYGDNTIVGEIPSVKITGFDLSADYGNPVQIVYHTIGNVLYVTNDASIVNTTTELNAVTIDNDIKRNRVIFDDNSDFLINDESAGALAAGDRLGISNFSFSFNREMDSFYSVNASDLGIDEPIGNAQPVPILTVSIPEFLATESVDFIQKLRSGGTFKAKLSFAKGTTYGFDLYMPSLRVTETAPAYDGPGRLPQEITFQCQATIAAPTGFDATGGVDPFYLDIKNQESTKPF